MLQLDATNPLQTPEKSPNPPQEKPTATKTAGRWTKEEHQRFIEGLKKFGKNWKQVEDHVKTRNGAQIRSHAQKFFLRLEKEFDMKFEDFDLHDNKKKFEETLKKLADSSYGNDYPTQEALANQEKMKLSNKVEKNLSAIQEKGGKFNSAGSHSGTVSQNSVRSTAFSQSNSPKLDHFEQPQLRKRPSRKMSEDILHTSTSNSLFDIIISKLRAGETDHRITSPKLSDLIDLSSSRKSSFNGNELNGEPFNRFENQGFINSSFRLNARKMSEDNVLINMNLSRLRRPEIRVFDDCEPLTKQFKVN